MKRVAAPVSKKEKLRGPRKITSREQRLLTKLREGQQRGLGKPSPKGAQMVQGHPDDANKVTPLDLYIYIYIVIYEPTYV